MNGLKDSLKTYQDYQKAYITNEKKLSYEQKHVLLKTMYDLLVTSFDFSSTAPVPLDTELWIKDECIDFMLPRIERSLYNKRIKDKDFQNFYKLWDKVMALTSRRSFHHFLIYMELDRSEQRRVYHKKRDVILKPFAYYFEKMMFSKEFTFFSDSKPPSSGKTFCVNYATAWTYGLNKDSSVLRISVAEDNVNTASNNIKLILQDKRFRNVFPYFEKLDNENTKLFEIEKLNAWKITGADVEASHLAVPMGGQIEGKRANKLIIVDDSLKQDDAHSEDIMSKNWEKYQSSISARADSVDVKEIMIGTMWHPNDLLGRKIVYESEGCDVVDGKFKYTKELWKNNKLVGVIIQTPMLDYDTEETTCEYVLTTERAIKKRDSMDEFLWQSAYQQRPIPPEGRLFEYDSLKQYDENKGKTIIYNGEEIKLSKYAKMSIDPTRKGKDKISCPIFKQNEDREHDQNEYLVDVIFKGKAMEEVYDDIISKIVLHNINFIELENNIDTSLAIVLKDRLSKFNQVNGTNYVVEISEKYNTTRKKQRIRDESYNIRTNMVFPKRGMFSQNSEIGQFMQNVTSYSDLLPNKNDDAPDSLALYSESVIRDTYQQKASAEAYDVNILFR